MNKVLLITSVLIATMSVISSREEPAIDGQTLLIYNRCIEYFGRSHPKLKSKFEVANYTFKRVPLSRGNEGVIVAPKQFTGGGYAGSKDFIKDGFIVILDKKTRKPVAIRLMG